MEITMDEYERVVGTTFLINRNSFDIPRILSEYENWDHEYLKPTFGQKSYYKKATVYKHGDGIRVLKSYSTVVLVKINGWYYRIWDGWSSTTMNHINSFIDTYGGFRLNKRMWTGLRECEPFHFNCDGETVEYKDALDELFEELPFY